MNPHLNIIWMQLAFEILIIRPFSVPQFDNFDFELPQGIIRRILFWYYVKEQDWYFYLIFLNVGIS